MKDKIKNFINTVYQSEVLKKSAVAFIEFEELINIIFNELPSTQAENCRECPIENRKRIYDLLVKYHTEGHIELLNYIITHTKVESLVYLYVHGLENEWYPFKNIPLCHPYLLNVVANFDRITSIVDAFILRKIVLSGEYRLHVEHRSLLERHIEKINLNKLTSGANEAQKIFAQAFVDSFLRLGNTSINDDSQLALTCASLLGEHWLVKVTALENLNRSASALEDTFREIERLFFNKKSCFSLLENLENDLKREYQSQGIDFSEYAVHDGIVSHNLKWPVFSTKASTQKTKGASHVLNELLLALERKHHINEPQHAPILFAKFIDSKEANKHVESGQLFEEFKYAGNPLHGSRSHRLQWHIVLRAIDEGILNLGSFSALDLVKSSTRYWGNTFDLYNRRYPEGCTIYTFTSPHHLHSTLLNAYETFPALSGCLRKSFAHTIKEISGVQPKDKPLSCSEIISKSDLLGAQFGSPGVEPDILAHYQARNKNLLFVYPSQEASELDKSKGCIFYKERRAKN